MIAIKGLFLDTPDPSAFRIREGFMISDGQRFLAFCENLPAEYAGAELHDYSGCLILPGFTDLHLHAPQYGYCGTAMDLELLDWLNRYTYPEEARFEDPAYAREAYSVFVRDLAQTATTRACIFATIHTDATLELMRLLEDAGMIAFVGKLNGNRNAPDYYLEATTAEGMAETKRWLTACETEGFRRVKPVLTPRFTPSVTDDYMAELGRLAGERQLPVQSHLSENPDEIAWVSELCPDTSFYGETYARYGLFGGGRPTVMAHCIYSPPEENALIRQNGVYIAHCPTSNANVIAGICPAAYYLRNQYRIGLGSDIAGGHTLNLFAVMAAAIQSSKLRWKYVDASERPLSLSEAFFMATAGGGSFFGKAGLFEPGYEADAVVIDDSELKGIRPFSPLERLERYTYLGGGRPEAKMVRGKWIMEQYEGNAF